MLMVTEQMQEEDRTAKWENQKRERKLGTVNFSPLANTQ